MKSKKNISFIFAWLLLFTQLAYSMSDNNNMMPPPSGGMPGGWFDADPNDPTVLDRARFAVDALRRSNTYSFELTMPSLPDIVVLDASQQVVAGMNYRLKIALRDGSGGCIGAFQVVIYDQFGELSITEWGNEITCEEAMAMLRNDDDLPENMAGGIAGGWFESDLNDPDLLAAARHAADELCLYKKFGYSFVANLAAAPPKVVVLQASQQVVAGMNYRMKILLQDGNGGCIGAFRVVVWDKAVTLEQIGDFDVTEWGSEIPCEQAMAMLAEREGFDLPNKDDPDD